MRVIHAGRDRYDLGPSAITIGKFGGVHRGHRALIARMRDEARTRGLAAVVSTFDRHPLAVLAPDRVPPALVSDRREEQLLAELDVDAVVVLPFTRAFAALAPEDFIRQVLVDGLDARLVVVGEDFRFGARGAGDVATLREAGRRLGFDVDAVPLVGLGATNAGRPGGAARPGGVMETGGVSSAEKCSSSEIRRLLVAGDVSGAAAMLGRAPDVGGFVVHGARRGRELGFPTANLGPGCDEALGLDRAVEGFVPADGVYAGWLDVFEGGPTGADTGTVHRHPAAISVGTNPTFADVPRTVEAHVIGRDDARVTDFDLYGRWARVIFVARLRGMVAYRGVEALVAQMRQDCADAAAALGIEE